MLSIQGQNITKRTQPNLNFKQTNLTFKPLEKPPLPKKKKKNIKVLKHDYVCDQRRQNQLQSRFIRKKQKLFQITRQNVRIFQKINSQKSIYSHESLNKVYQSNKSLANSRTTNKSKNSLKKSQISNYSKSSQKSNKSNKNNFFNRANSAKSFIKPSNSKIIINDIKRKSLTNLKSKGIKQTKAQDIQQFAALFNIKQQPTKKQLNRPIRIKSTKSLRPIKSKTNQTTSFDQKTINLSKQIVINEQNQIQIHEEIEIQQGGATYRNKSSRAQSQQGNSKISQQSHLKEVENNTKINIIPCQTQKNLKTQHALKNSNRSLRSQRSQDNQKFNRQNIQNLFEIKNSNLKSSFAKKFGNEKVASKYSNLISKINSQLNKHNAKKPKQTTIYPYRSRLIV